MDIVLYRQFNCYNYDFRTLCYSSLVNLDLHRTATQVSRLMIRCLMFVSRYATATAWMTRRSESSSSSATNGNGRTWAAATCVRSPWPWWGPSASRCPIFFYVLKFFKNPQRHNSWPWGLFSLLRRMSGWGRARRSPKCVMWPVEQKLCIVPPTHGTVCRRDV